MTAWTENENWPRENAAPALIRSPGMIDRQDLPPAIGQLQEADRPAVADDRNALVRLAGAIDILARGDGAVDGRQSDRGRRRRISAPQKFSFWKIGRCRRAAARPPSGPQSEPGAAVLASVSSTSRQRRPASRDAVYVFGSITPIIPPDGRWAPLSVFLILSVRRNSYASAMRRKPAMEAEINNGRKQRRAAPNRPAQAP